MIRASVLLVRICVGLAFFLLAHLTRPARARAVAVSRLTEQDIVDRATKKGY